MRETIGGTWIMQLVIVFMLIFVAFLALSLNYSKAFQMKNELLTMIEKKEGLTDGSNGSIALINNYLSSNAYRVKRACPVDSYGVSDLNRTTAEKVTNASSGKQYYYCVQKVDSPSTNHKEKVFYKVNIFFYFNLPIIGDIFKFTINGATNDIVVPADNLESITE